MKFTGGSFSAAGSEKRRKRIEKKIIMEEMDIPCTWRSDGGNHDSGNSKDVSDDEKAQLKSQAEAIASGLKEGGDLNALAEEQGATVQTLTFDKDTTSPDEDLIKAADALGEGESTDVIETEKGCYVAKVTSLLDRTATDSKKSQIVQERQTKLYDDTVKKWRKKADIKVHKGVWKKVSFQKVSVKMKTETQTPYTDQVQTDDQAQTDNKNAVSLKDMKKFP